MDNEEVQVIQEVKEEISTEENKVLSDEKEILSDEKERQEINSTDEQLTTSDEIISKDEVQTILEGYSLQDFNTLNTTDGELKLNEQIYLEMKTTNLYLNLILIAVVLCFLYYVISKALKKLFYINIF